MSALKEMLRLVVLGVALAVLFVCIGGLAHYALNLFAYGWALVK